MPAVEEQNGIWSVPLSAQHTPYAATALRRKYAALPQYTVVVVDTQQFMRAYERDDPGYVLPKAAGWPADMLARARDQLAPKGAGQPALEMPHAHIQLQRRRRLFGWLADRLVPVVAFTDGRHRARYLEFAGAAAFPVEVNVNEAALMQEWCGAAATAK